MAVPAASGIARERWRRERLSALGNGIFSRGILGKDDSPV